MKPPKSIKTSHTSNSKIGMGDYYGAGIKNKTGRVIEDMVNYSAVTKKSLKKPPKSLA